MSFAILGGPGRGETAGNEIDLTRSGGGCDGGERVNGTETAGDRHRIPRVAAFAPRPLWFADWAAQEIIAVDPEGSSEVIVPGDSRPSRCVDGCRMGGLLIVAGREGRLLRHEPDGSLETYADLGGLVEKGLRERDRRRRPRQRLSQQCRLRLCRAGVRARHYRGGRAGRLGLKGGRRRRLPQRHGCNRRRLDPDRRRVLRRQADRVLYRRRTAALTNRSNLGRYHRRPHPRRDLSSTATAPPGTPMLAQGYCVRVREGGELLQTIELDRGCFRLRARRRGRGERFSSSPRSGVARKSCKAGKRTRC